MSLINHDSALAKCTFDAQVQTVLALSQVQGQTAELRKDTQDAVLSIHVQMKYLEDAFTQYKYTTDSKIAALQAENAELKSKLVQPVQQPTSFQQSNTYQSGLFSGTFQQPPVAPVRSPESIAFLEELKKCTGADSLGRGYAYSMANKNRITAANGDHIVNLEVDGKRYLIAATENNYIQHVATLKKFIRETGAIVHSGVCNMSSSTKDIKSSLLSNW